jgi:DsbC/DsbD-like thiol-disulfide interchange protein
MGNEEILFTQPKSTHDGATPSGNSVAVRILSRLARRTGKLEYENLANGVLKAFSGSISEYPASYAYMLAQLDELLNGEIASRQYAARGAIRLSGRIDRTRNHQYELIVDLDIAEGWHVNASKPLHEDLIPTKISIALDDWWELESLQYPEAFMKKVDFEEQPLALYQGRIQIRSKLKPKSKNNMGRSAFPINISVQIQACNEEACLPPETVKLSVILAPDQ